MNPRIVAVLVIIALLTVFFAWLLSEVSGSGFWSNLRDVLTGLLNIAWLAIPLGLLIYAGGVLATGRWSW